MNRTVRLGEQIRQELATLLTRNVHDPGIGFVTLTRVRVSDDLLQARVYYTALGDAPERTKTARALDRALPFLRRALGERLRLRRVPALAFTYDESVGHQARVEELLEEIRREDASRSAAEAGADEKPRRDSADE